MATILLGAAGAAIGSGFGGTVLGLSGAVIGRAVGATLGRVLDQKLIGAGSEAVEVGRVDRFRLMGASDGSPIPRVWGRTRIAGQVIWATRFQESRRRSGGKGAPQPRTDTFTYSISLAVALCEGVIAGVGRIWADGSEVDPTTLNLRVYTGDDTQLPDPKIEAVEGAGLAPSYRGIAYVVLEDLDLGRFGNRVPQLNFEVLRHAEGHGGLRDVVRSVALIPGTGEYALATEAVRMQEGPGRGRVVNVNTPSGRTDLVTSLGQLRTELPNVGSISLIVSWFGDDLRANHCTVKPKVEQNAVEGDQAWRAGGIARSVAETVPFVSGSPVFGGTPSDASVVQAIQAIRDGGQEAMFYPFILMGQLSENGRPDPWTGAPDQPHLPWRGRITTAVAPGRPGTADRTYAAEAEVASFFGEAQPSHFSGTGSTVIYSGPSGDWGYRRFILHYARLCAQAGGVDAFCIGSELRGITQIRGEGDSFPSVAALKALAADVRAILGPATKISYAADWSEYFGYHIDGNVYFHLDPLWSDANIDFIGIDNYMPLSDWREAPEEADGAFGSIYNLDYLAANVAGGEGFDWYYDDPEGAAAQRRLPITDGSYGEPWVFRVKDLKGWWSNFHHERISGARNLDPTEWLPQSKPIRFTEYGCAAIDKGTNEPNKFLDPKSSESGVPRASDGRRDDLIVMQYLRAMHSYWSDDGNNPFSSQYSGHMVDVERAHAWAWDARPFPAFPSRADLWSDASNYSRGHWINGRSMNQALSGVVEEICAQAGVTDADARRALGVVRGYSPEGLGTARAALQPLMLAHAVDAVERDGLLTFSSRALSSTSVIDHYQLAVSGEIEGPTETERAPDAEMAGRVRLAFVEAEGDFEQRQADAIFPDDRARAVSQTEFPMVLTAHEGRVTAERWLAEARLARDGIRFALPPSAAEVGAGDTVSIKGATYRIDRADRSGALLVEATRVEGSTYSQGDGESRMPTHRPFVAPGPVDAIFLDLPLLKGSEIPHAPHLAVAAMPWPGTVAAWSASDGSSGFEVNSLLPVASVVGVSETPLAAARTGTWDRGLPLRVRLVSGSLEAATPSAVLNGANAMAIGDGSADLWEVFQFVEATLIAPLTWELSVRLRGQSGSDAAMPPVWPAGSRVVLLDGVPSQVSLPLSARGLARTWRVGPMARGFDHSDVVERSVAFAGNGLRPYAPCHLRLRPEGAGVMFSWVRRTRIDGDSWISTEVPVGEEFEAYRVRIMAGASIARTVDVSVPSFIYTVAMRAADAIVGPVGFSVAQLSAQFGPGPFSTVIEPV